MNDRKEKIPAASKKFGKIPEDDMNSMIGFIIVLDNCAVILTKYGESIVRKSMETAMLTTNNAIDI